MIRLFISLYLVVIIGLLTINWGSEFLWRQFAQHNSYELTQISNMARSLPYLLKQEQKTKISFFEVTGIPLTYVSVNDISWLSHQKKNLNTGEPVVIYNKNDQPSIYIQNNSTEQLIQLGPFPLQQTDKLTKYLILLGSYILLALFISLWIQPVWRDLRYLKTTAAQIKQNNFTIIGQNRSRSPISAIVKAFNNMASTITNLLAEQKQLINAVSHELRTPLSRLRFSLALVENIKTEQSAEINQDISEIECLIDEMLSYSRIEHVSQELSKSQVNITELLINQVEKLQRGTHIKLKINIADHLVFSCQGELIERACQNLIVNAIGHAKAEVIVLANTQNRQLTITVCDDGNGIPLANRNEVFNAFHRLDKSRNKNHGGVGLGLAIVKKAMDWHRGQCIASESTLGGASFIITIPDLNED